MSVTVAAEHFATIQSLVPLLFVTDLHRSIAFYRDKLGFELEGEPVKSRSGEAFFCGIRRQGCSLMLQKADEKEDGPAAGRGRGIVFYFIVDDADRMHEELTARGMALEPPTTAYYGMRQVHVPEPDGYELCFESRVK